MRALVNRWKELAQVHWGMCLHWHRRGDREQSEASRARATTLELCALDLEIELRGRSKPIFRRRVPFWTRLSRYVTLRMAKLRNFRPLLIGTSCAKVVTI